MAPRTAGGALRPFRLRHPHPVRMAVMSAVLLPLGATASYAQYSAPILPSPVAPAASGLPSAAGTSGYAAAGRPGWSVRTLANVEETYTDNVRLATRGHERSDFVTALRPTIDVAHLGPRANFSLTYAPQLIYRANESTHDVYQYLNAAGNAELVKQLFYLDAQGYMSQQNVSLLGPQATSNVNNTGNRTSVRMLNLSPYLRHEFGTASQALIRYGYSVVDYSNNSLFNSESNSINAKLTSGPAYKLLTWHLDYDKEHINYPDAHQAIDLQRATAGGRRLVTPTLGVQGNVGYEDNSYIVFGTAPKGKFWSVGPEWTPTPRTRLVATVGRRYYGRTHMLDFSHRTRLTTWRVDYSEDITTARSQAVVPVTVDTATYLDTLLLPRIPDPIARRNAVDTFISQTGIPGSLTTPVNFLTTLPFLQKRLHGSFGIQGVRNTLLFSAFHLTRDVAAAGASVAQAGAGDLAATPRTVQTGAGAVWTSRVTPFTTSNVSVDVTRNTFPQLAREDRITVLRASLVKQFQPKVSGSVAVRRLQGNSNQGGASYRENAVIVALNIRF